MRRQVRPRGQRVQLHRALSKLGWGSRTQAWTWIQDGKVRVDGQIVVDPLTWVDLSRQEITCGGASPQTGPMLVIALHKPKGIVTTRRDERGRKNVYDLLPKVGPWVFPAGRLDADSEGLLIFTNDSQLAVRLTDPEGHVPKTYRVTLDREPESADVARLKHGIVLDDGPTRPARVRILQSEGKPILEMVLTEGRNRQIRRMWRALGYRVKRLVRTAIGRFELGTLRAGECRALSAKEVAALHQTSR